MKKKILFIVNHAAFFVSHRLILAEEIIKKGWDFKLAIGKPASETMEKVAELKLKNKKIKYVRTLFSSNFSINFLSEIISLFQLAFTIIKFKPDIVHIVSPKAILIGGLACRMLNKKKIVIAISGLGSLETYNTSLLTNILNKFYFIVLKNIIYNKFTKIIVQNSDDKIKIKKVLNIVNKKNILIIPGSGVKKNKKNKSNVRKNNKLILMASRILIDKGIIEYFQAAKYLKKKFKEWTFLLIGPIDYKSHASLDKKQFKKLLNEKNVKWLGYKQNIEKYIIKSSIICLPSYREGMSKFLIEGVMHNKPIITTNVPGCKDLVINGKTGFLSKPKDAFSIAKNLEKLISNQKLLKKFEKNYSKFNKTKFESKNIINKTIQIYKDF